MGSYKVEGAELGLVSAHTSGRSSMGPPTSPPEEAVMRLQGKMETEPAYKAMFGE